MGFGEVDVIECLALTVCPRLVSGCLGTHPFSLLPAHNVVFKKWEKGKGVECCCCCFFDGRRLILSTVDFEFCRSFINFRAA